ncbi:MAG: ATP-dependent DNA ligase, partial [Methanosarcinales archaeon]|nr:ATP-dependent DNA ligase [Methanosarcinales archaeon]
MTSFQEFANLCQRICEVSGSLEKVEILAAFLAELEGPELEVAANFVMGKVFPQSDVELGVGPSILYDALSRAMGFSQEAMAEILRATGDPGLVAARVAEKKKPLTLAAFMESDQLSIMDVYRRFQAVSRASGKGSQDAKVKNLQFLFSESTPLEALYLARLAMEDLRIGVGEGLVRDAIARAFAQPVELVERGYNLTNDLGLAARHARLSTLGELDLALNRPIKMMLAQIGESIESSLKEGATAIEWKFDGARVQIHKNGEAVRIFSRRLEDVTASLPEIVSVVHRHVQATTAILDGEAVAMGEDGRPRPFQDILRRFRRKYHVSRKAAEIPLRLNLFDIVYLEGETLLDLPLEERRKLLLQAADEEIVARQQVSSDPEVVQAIYSQALAAGHEG